MSLRPPNENPDEVVALRSGDVLLKGTILKSDHFPGACVAHHPLLWMMGGGFEALLPHTALVRVELGAPPCACSLWLPAGCQNTKLPIIEGAPNFRQVPGLPIYGIAIPTVTGLRRVLDKLGAAKGRRRVLWHSMREEPVRSSAGWGSGEARAAAGSRGSAVVLSTCWEDGGTTAVGTGRGQRCSAACCLLDGAQEMPAAPP